ncbi:hypothetical protein QV13_15680 [Mesorhizobium hungaricum]|uniref:TonB C-terminal domain-containing protein n=2 Tax=Hyphomicrobiales TaxID=356 RepID=A0A1C2DNP2_9HYPH|nr:hypothetical protein QV13_15680 [Mesorhizobium hungaricum]
MELQPAISNRTSSRPLAGADASMPAGGDPEIAIPGGVLQPDPPEQASLDDSANADIEPLPAEPDYVAETRPAASVRKWSLAFVASLVFHLAVAAMLIFAPESILPPRELTPTEIAGANGTKPLLFGNEENDATAAGADQQRDVTNVTVVPESELQPPRKIQPQPENPPSTQPAQPTKEQAQPPKEQVQPTKEPQQQPVEPSPNVLAIPQTQDEKDAVAVLEGRPTAKLEIMRPVMPEPSEAERQLAEQETHPAPQAPAEQPQKPARPKSASGAGGQAENDALRGVNEGREDGSTTLSGITSAQTGAGNAAASRFSGQVQGKLDRANRRVSRATQAKALSNAVVSFIVMADGGVVDVRLMRSSGSPELDKFAVALVKGVAPYPPIPPETGRKAWPFTVQIGPFL